MRLPSGSIEEHTYQMCRQHLVRKIKYLFLLNFADIGLARLGKRPRHYFLKCPARVLHISIYVYT